MQLTWKASESASALHAAHALSRGFALVPPGLSEAIGPLVAEPPVASRGDLPALLAGLVEHAAAGIEHNRELAERTLARRWGAGGVREAEVSALAAWVSSLERVYYDWHRGRSKAALVDEIVTRTAPIKDQWQTRGPGLIVELARLTEPWLVASEAQMVMVLPAIGGDGSAHLARNLVTFEAVLTDADDRLPEVSRLVWLLAQLQFDLPAIAEVVKPGNVARIAQLAMLPPVLAAGEAVEVTQYSPELITQALGAWRVASSDPEATLLAGQLATWWDTYLHTEITWPAAVAALEAMLGR
jgi:hypothetical protein